MSYCGTCCSPPFRRNFWDISLLPYSYCCGRSNSGWFGWQVTLNYVCLAQFGMPADACCMLLPGLVGEPFFFLSVVEQSFACLDWALVFNYVYFFYLFFLNWSLAMAVQFPTVIACLILLVANYNTNLILLRKYQPCSVVAHPCFHNLFDVGCWWPI